MATSSLVTDVDGLDVTHVPGGAQGNQVNGLRPLRPWGDSYYLVRYGRSVFNLINMSFFRPVGS